METKTFSSSLHTIRDETHELHRDGLATYTSIFIVDDHPLIRNFLSHLINQEADLKVVGEADNACEARKKIDRIRPDMAIVDISLCGTSGIELTKNLLIAYSKMMVLIMSMHDEYLYGERALRAGARGYLMKNEAITTVIPAIRRILSGNVYVSDRLKENLILQFSGQSTTRTTQHDKLSDRELEVLQLTGQGYSTKVCAETLHVSAKTIETHYSHIKNKLGLKNGHELIQYAVKVSMTE